MEWFNKAKLKIVAIVGSLLGVGMIVASMIPGCEGAVGTLRDAKKGVEMVEPLVAPGSDAVPDGAR